MHDHALRRVNIVWFALTAATAVSWFFGTGHSSGSDAVITAVVLTVALVKVRLIGMYFMELRTAPVWLRATFETYVAVVLVTLLVLYAVL